MDLQIEDYTLGGLDRVNILLGKNGVGKSTLLRKLQGAETQTDPSSALTTSYITPERGGVLTYEANIEHSIRHNPRWMPKERRKNQTPNFRQQTVAQFRDLESVVSQEIERLVEQGTAPEREMLFGRYVEKINSLLEQIEIRRDKKIFSMYRKGTDEEIESQNISSGESELIALAIETLVFMKEEDFNRPKVLLLDEPDVHLHPDLQVRFMRFLYKAATDGDFTVVIATHSTAILGALEDFDGVNVAFVTPGQREINFESIKKTYKKFLPVFGAHPLSNIFNEAPVLLIEGEDDERIWQSVVRSSRGTIKVFPCVCGDVQSIAEYERDVNSVISSVYDNATAYSLRDKDNADETDLSDEGAVIRLRLKCRAVENLLLADEVIASTEAGSWAKVEERLEAWVESAPDNPYVQKVVDFQIGGYDRKNFDLKDIRNILLLQTGESKPWEILVGQAMSNLTWSDTTDFAVRNTLYSYLGEKIVKALFPKA